MTPLLFARIGDYAYLTNWSESGYNGEPTFELLHTSQIMERAEIVLSTSDFLVGSMTIVFVEGEDDRFGITEWMLRKAKWINKQRESNMESA